MQQVLTLLEGKWFPQKHVTMMDLFRPLFGVWSDSADLSCHYEQFTNESAFRASIGYAFTQRRPDIIYIGAHGGANSIYGFHDEGISRTVVRNSFLSMDGTTKRGVFFGSCSFVTEETANFIIPACARVLWLGGYEKEREFREFASSGDSLLNSLDEMLRIG